MQRIFNQNQASIFAEKSTNEQMISDLAISFQTNSDPASGDISRLLFMVQTFLAQTEPAYQANRDKLIDDKKIQPILETAGKALQDFQKKYEKLGNKNADGALVYCKRAIDDQLKIMKNNNDKIYLYYAAHENTLNDMLNTPNKINIKP